MARHDLGAVTAAVIRQMDALRISTAELRRRSGLSETTIRGVTQGTGKPRRSTLVAISAVLGWPYDYLDNILLGEPQKNVESPLEKHLAELVVSLAELAALRADMAVLIEAVHRIDEKTDVMIAPRRPPATPR